jgi:DNA anti-recombination protein RmuC
VTITHPHHPLRGQQLPVVCVRRGESPDVIVRLPDGSHAAVALSATDYVIDSSASLPPVRASHLLDLQGLRQMAQFIDGLRRQGRFPEPSR